jgi:pyoverdine/dityrosine biosynthesis protein Dit1
MLKVKYSSDERNMVRKTVTRFMMEQRRMLDKQRQNRMERKKLLQWRRSSENLLCVRMKA